MRNAIPTMLLVLWPAVCWAAAGRFDVGTFHFKSYQRNWQAPFSHSQWGNTDDWTDEIGDIAYLYTEKNPKNLTARLESDPAHFFDYDIVFIQTHGKAGKTGPDAWANLMGYEDGLWSDVTKMSPNNDEMEVMLLLSCEILSKDGLTDWYVLRNLHRYGALVTAGCYGDCSIYDVTVDTTLNELGDAIVANNKIKNAWLHSFDIVFEASDDDIAIMGLGSTAASNCDNRARNVNRKNRLGYTKYHYAEDLEPWGGYEICGYYWDDA